MEGRPRVGDGRRWQSGSHVRLFAQLGIFADDIAFDFSQTSIYASGAGLGATKPKDISKFASDYTGYVNLAKDAVRARALFICSLY